MDSLISSGRIADVILVVLAIELLLFGLYMWRRGQGLALLSFAAATLAGGSLVLALRAVLRESGGLFVAMYLGAALLAHLADLALRVLATRYANGLSSDETPNHP